MNTATVQVEALPELAEVTQIGSDPMAPRWGMNATVREKYVEARGCGFEKLPYARFFPITRFSYPEEVHSTDETTERERRVVNSAEFAQLYLEEMLAGKTAFGKPQADKQNLGLIIGFVDEADAGKMAILSRTILPPLSQIRQLAVDLNIPCPIEVECPGDDEFDFESRESCPTCWRTWTESALCDAYLEQVAMAGMQVEDIKTGNVRTVIPSLEELETGRNLAGQSLRLGLFALQATWTQITKELQAGDVRHGLDDGGVQNTTRKDLHEGKPEDRQLRVVQGYAKAATSDTAAILEMLAKGQAQTNELLVKMAEKEDKDFGAPMTPAQERMAHVRAARGQKKEQ